MSNLNEQQHLDVLDMPLVILERLFEQRHRQHDGQRENIGVRVDGTAGSNSQAVCKPFRCQGRFQNPTTLAL